MNAKSEVGDDGDGLGGRGGGVRGTKKRRDEGFEKEE